MVTARDCHGQDDPRQISDDVCSNTTCESAHQSSSRVVHLRPQTRHGVQPLPPHRAELGGTAHSYPGQTC